MFGDALDGWVKDNKHVLDLIVDDASRPGCVQDADPDTKRHKDVVGHQLVVLSSMWGVMKANLMAMQEKILGFDPRTREATGFTRQEVRDGTASVLRLWRKISEAVSPLQVALGNMDPNNIVASVMGKVKEEEQDEKNNTGHAGAVEVARRIKALEEQGTANATETVRFGTSWIAHAPIIEPQVQQVPYSRPPQPAQARFRARTLSKQERQPSSVPIEQESEGDRLDSAHGKSGEELRVRRPKLDCTSDGGAAAETANLEKTLGNLTVAQDPTPEGPRLPQGPRQLKPIADAAEPMSGLGMVVVGRSQAPAGATPGAGAYGRAGAVAPGRPLPHGPIDEVLALQVSGQNEGLPGGGSLPGTVRPVRLEPLPNQGSATQSCGEPCGSEASGTGAKPGMLAKPSGDAGAERVAMDLQLRGKQLAWGMGDNTGPKTVQTDATSRSNGYPIPVPAKSSKRLLGAIPGGHRRSGGSLDDRVGSLLAECDSCLGQRRRTAGPFVQTDSNGVEERESFLCSDCLSLFASLRWVSSNHCLSAYRSLHPCPPSTSFHAL